MNIDGTTGLGRSAYLGQGQPDLVQKREKLAIEYDVSLEKITFLSEAPMAPEPLFFVNRSAAYHFVTCCWIYE